MLSPESEHEIDLEIAKFGLGANYRYTDLIPRPFDHYGAFDILAMVSREDPFPLVNLECAALGVPVVCFDAAGGSGDRCIDCCFWRRADG